MLPAATPGVQHVVPAATASIGKTNPAQDSISAVAASSTTTCLASTSEGVPSQPAASSQQHQHQQQYLNTPSTPPTLTSSGVVVTSSSSPPLSTSALSSSSSRSSPHLRLQQHQSSLPVFKPSLGQTGIISGIGTITSKNHSGFVPGSGGLSSPLVIPTPNLSRASSSGTFIPHTELAVPASTANLPASVNTCATTNSTSGLTSTDSVVSVAALTSRSSTAAPVVVSSSNSSSAITNSSSQSRMQEQPEKQDKKPVVPQPGAFLPPSVGVPFPYHSYYYPHSGAAHLPPHLHPSMSVASSVGGSPHQPPPPVPSLIPIKKEPHSPPPLLKPSDKATDLSSSSSSFQAVHRPHSENPPKLPHGFSHSGLPLTAPLPPPPLTVIDHRDGAKPDELSKAESYTKDNPRGLPPSPHRPDSHPMTLHRESRLDSNLSVLRESREIGLVGGLNSTQPGQQLPLASVKEEPRSLSAAFQPYSHHPHSSSTSSSAPVLPTHSTASVLQVPQPHLSLDQSHGSASLMSSQSMLSDSSQTITRPAANPDIESLVKKEPITIEDIDVDEDDDDMRGGTTTPGPTPTVCNREIYKSNSAM